MSKSAPIRVTAAPTKSFFVSMLTRDIILVDAILDLLDNCVDGINRTGRKDGQKPYDGFWADIKFDAKSFSITDNCGGIPSSEYEYAFRMGRPLEAEPVRGSVGVYGIGMKRAIFKMGRRCTISTQSGDSRYEIKITPEWLKDEKTWEIDVSSAESSPDGAGTAITIDELNGGIAKMFKDAENFHATLAAAISTHYAYIIDKGFKVTINGKAVAPKTISILYSGTERDGDVINPFVYKDEVNGVKVNLVVGLSGHIPSDTNLSNNLRAPTRSSENAGWTVLCNGRAVLYCDKTELTGWGEGNVPRYHTQFIAISGVVEFWADYGSDLPTTTTKRGLDASSSLYLQVKNKMREGMKIFTTYTDKWKGKSEESKTHTANCQPLPLNTLEGQTNDLPLRKVPHMQNAKQYKPHLPLPAVPESNEKLIKFYKDEKEIREVAEYFGEPDLDPDDVGSKCFDAIHDETGQ